MKKTYHAKEFRGRFSGSGELIRLFSSFFRGASCLKSPRSKNPKAQSMRSFASLSSSAPIRNKIRPYSCTTVCTCFQAMKPSKLAVMP